MARRVKVKRERGRGSVYFDATTGMWAGQVIIDGRRVKRRGATAEEVARKLDELLDHQAAGLTLQGATMTVAEMLAAYVESRHGRVSEATTLNDEATARHVADMFGERRAVALTPLDIERGLRRKLRAGLSPAYVARMRSLLVNSYRWARRHQLVDRDPAVVTDTIPGATTVQRPLNPLSVLEARDLLDEARGHRLGVIAFLGVMAGLRPAEMRALVVTDVDLERQVLSVTGQADASGRRGATKTRRSRRAVRMPAELVDVLADHLDRLGEERRIAGTSWPANGLAVVTERGTPVDSSNMRRVVAEWAARAGLDRSVTPYDLRSTFASLGLAGGASLHEVAQLLGHSDTRTAERHYVHHLDDVHERGTVVGKILDL